MLKVENLRFSYNGQSPWLLDGIDLMADRGDYISIIGDNGSGKSTLVKLMLELLKPVSGSISNNFARTAYMPQKVDSLNAQFPITVREVLECYRKSIRVRDRACVMRCLTQVGMEGFADRLIGGLSGGQAQRVFLARALIGSPDLLILDEPSSGVDLTSRQELYSLIKDLNTDHKVAVIAVEHNLKAAVRNSTMIYHLSGGSGHVCSTEAYLKEYIRQSGGLDV